MRVLLVDPEGDLLPGLQGPLLGVPGVELYCAPDGATAIQHAAFLGGVDVLLTEVFLQGLDGFALRDNLRTATPTVRTIFLTRHDLGAYADGLQGAHVLRIPVPPEQLLPLISPPQAAQTSSPPPLPPRVSTSRNSLQTPLAPAATQPPVSAATAPRETPAPSTPIAAVYSLAEAMPLTKLPLPAPVSPRTPAIAKSTPPGESIQEQPPIAPASTPPALKGGLVLGPYKLLREDEPTAWGPTFTAVHSTLGRPVTLVMLSAQQSLDQGIRTEFLEEAGAKASVQHSAVLTVYEACELEGHTFYTMERVDGLNLLELAERRQALSVETTLRLAQTAAEGMQYMRARGVTHSPLKASAVVLAADGSPRLRNLALGGLRPATSEAEDVATLGRCLEGVLGADAPLALRSLLERTAPNHKKNVAGWTEFLCCVAECEAAWARFSSNSGPNPTPPPPLSRKRFPLIWVGVVLGVAAAGGAFFWNRAKTPLIPAQVHIPKGQYLVGSGRRVNLEGFLMDRSEVSNRQYGRFLEWQRSHPAEANSFDHPDQPARHSHQPPYWKDRFPEVARHRAEVDDPRWELPVTEVSWWDAYAFAHWAGRDLPTEDEWEAAGRGPRGLLFPWGDEPDPERTNVKRLPRPGEVPSPMAVEALKDPSAFGVRGLSGNVSEWTSTVRDTQGAVAKGGHFNAPLLTLDAASPLPPETRSPSLGFRTVARKPSRP
jgi:formylglycine-generating enzyme required for sulfatase activity/CheY-like chemotaxis protein